MTLKIIFVLLEVSAILWCWQIATTLRSLRRSHLKLQIDLINTRDQLLDTMNKL